MHYPQFVSATRLALPRDTILPNPRSGTTRIVKYSGDTLVYQRGESRFYVSLQDLYHAFEHFQGSDVSSRDLREYAPSVFDSKKGGHSCNCTMLFLILVAIGIADIIEGRGVAGHPFRVRI